MRLSSWLSGVRSHLFRSTRQTRKLSVSRRGAVASMVQVLESRVLLSAVNWTGAGWDLQWNTAANWDTNATPGATDDVTIGVVGASAIQIAGNSADVHSLLSNSPIEIVDTSLRLEAGGGFIGGLNVAVGGSLVVAGGTATCESSGTIAGTMTIGAGAALVLMGSQNLTSTSTLSGAGEVDFDTGYHTVAGTYAITASTTVRENGIADFLSSDKTVSVGNSLVIESGGLANFHDHPLSVPYLEILGGELDQDGPIDVTSQFVWLTGTLRGSGTVLVEDNPETVPNFILSNEPGLQDNIWTLDQKTVKNEGTGVISLEDLVTSAEVQFENHGHLVNDGTLTVLSDSTPCTVSFRSVDSSFSEFTNWGVLTIDAGAESGLESYISLFNGGLIGVQTGMFSSVAGGVVTGSIEVEGGATLELDGEFSLNEESEVSGAGDVYLQLGYATGTNNIVIYGTYDVSGITYCKEGTVIVTSSGDFTVEGLFLSECTFYNYGLMTIGVGDENPCQVSNTFFNLGTLELRSGQFEISTSDYILAGVTQLIGGSILVDSDPLHLNGGGLLSGSGLVTGAFVNDGIVGPGFSPGVITVTGNYSQTRGGQLTIELEGTTPGTEYDQLVVGGDVALAGTLYVSGFNSSEGQSFTIIRNDGTNPVSGTFAGLGEGDCLVVGTRLLQISYQGGDGNDVTLTDRLYIVSNTADGGTGSLRQAILDADASPGSHTISFHIPGGGTHMISPQSALPVITNSVTLDGTTQPGYAGSPVIEIDGGSAGAGNVAGLSVGASGTVIRGLDIGNFSGPGLEINGDLLGSPLTGVTVEQNWLGLNPFGTGAQANQTGLSATNVTGLHIANNVISGNTTSGVVLTRADQSVIVGNRIGTTVSGTAGLANGETGIVLGDQVLHSVIGGSTPALRNTIALNGVNGVSITGASVGNTIRG
ncbi:MAG: right-handed parallel beta-helix repeat-containing protein, partial [Planctomycetota bacterium]|nr:right-handed parallel beta-helix repeat-containing protein [Planctomycetota bacterium]